MGRNFQEKPRFKEQKGDSLCQLTDQKHSESHNKPYRVI